MSTVKKTLSRYKVSGPAAVAGVRTGEVLHVDPDDVDEYGRHLVNDQRVLLAAAVAGGVLEPLSKAAEETASVEASQQPGAGDVIETRG